MNPVNEKSDCAAGPEGPSGRLVGAVDRARRLSGSGLVAALRHRAPRGQTEDSHARLRCLRGPARPRRGRPRDRTARLSFSTVLYELLTMLN